MFAAIISFKVVKSPTKFKPPFNIAITATKTNNIAPTLTAKRKPSVVPLAIASKTLEPIFS